MCLNFGVSCFSHLFSLFFSFCFFFLFSFLFSFFFFLTGNGSSVCGRGVGQCGAIFAPLRNACRRRARAACGAASLAPPAVARAACNGRGKRLRTIASRIKVLIQIHSQNNGPWCLLWPAQPRKCCPSAIAPRSRPIICACRS